MIGSINTFEDKEQIMDLNDQFCSALLPKQANKKNQEPDRQK